MDKSELARLALADREAREAYRADPGVNLEFYDNGEWKPRTVKDPPYNTDVYRISEVQPEVKMTVGILCRELKKLAEELEFNRAMGRYTADEAKSLIDYIYKGAKIGG